MPLYYSIDGKLRPSREVGPKAAALSSKSGAFTPDMMIEHPDTKKLVAFTPIGPGEALTITLRTVYPGHLPRKSGGLFRSRGVMVSSAVKSWQTFDAQPRALNMIKKEIARATPVPVPAATEEGTRIVFYSPALVDRSLTVTVEMAIDDVDAEFFKAISSIFSAAGGLPIFASAAPYLLAAGALFDVSGKIGNSIFDSKAEFQGTEILSFGVGGEVNAVAGYAVLTRNELEEDALKNFSVGNGQRLEAANGVAYDGPTPYAVIALDGAKDPRLEIFKANAASAALLQRFYNIRPGGETAANDLIEALGFYNDFRYRKEADEIAETLMKGGLSDGEKEALKAKLEAVKKNIKSEYFRAP